MSRIKQPNFKVTTNNAEGILLNSLNGGDIILSANTGSIILSAPSGTTYSNDYSGNYTDRSLVDKGYVLSQISSLTGNTGGVTGATNGLSLYNNNCIGLGGSLNGNTCINLDSGYLYLRDATEDNTITLSYYAFDASYSDGTSISRIYVESGDVWLNSINNSTNNMSMICVIPTKLCLYATEANNDICSNIDIAYNTIQISSYSGISSVQNVNFSGITYAHNYSDNFTNRSLVDKEYVDNKTVSSSNNIVFMYNTGLIPDSGNTILVSGGTSVTLSLPTTSSIKKSFKIKDVSGNANANNIIIDSGSGRYIDGSRCAVINTNYGGFELLLGKLCNWYVTSFVN